MTTARRYTRTLRDIIIRLFMRTIRSRCIDGEFNDSSLYVLLLLLLLSFRTDANGRCHRVFRARVVDKLFWVETKKKKINVRKTAMIIIIYCDSTVTCRVQEDNAPCNCFFHFFFPRRIWYGKKNYFNNNYTLSLAAPHTYYTCAFVIVFNRSTEVLEH